MKKNYILLIMLIIGVAFIVFKAGAEISYEKSLQNNFVGIISLEIHVDNSSGKKMYADDLDTLKYLENRGNPVFAFAKNILVRRIEILEFNFGEGCGNYEANYFTFFNKPIGFIGGGSLFCAGEFSVDLSNRGLEKVPSVALQDDLNRLNLSNNKITGILPHEIGQLQNLRFLDLSNNQLIGLPAEIGELKKLEYLNLSNNEITKLPNQLANLKDLKILNLSGNNYSRQDLEFILQELSSELQIIE